MRSFQPAPILALLPSLLLAGCETPDEGIVESRARAVLDAQYAAEGKTPPMQAEEADRIYENYLENIGKPMETGKAVRR